MNRLQNGLLRRPPHQQAGITALGLIFLIVFLGIFAFGIIRLTPVYLNYMKIAGVVDGVVREFEGQNATVTTVRRSIQRRFDVESVGQIKYRDVIVTGVDGGLQVSAVYDHTAPFMGDISFTVHFDKTELVRR